MALRPVRFPAGSQGVLTTGGSMANLSAVVTARHAKLGEDFLDGTYYVSEQAHATVTKAATIAGFGRRNLRIVPTDAELRMDPDALAAHDRARTARPGCVRSWCRGAGTTNTGAIDPLDAIADVARGEGLWFHVDAAYGGFFQLTERGRERFRGIERADSDHPRPAQGSVPAVRHGRAGRARPRGAARRALRGRRVPAGPAAPGELPNYSEYSPELSRDMRGLRVWFPLLLHGVAAFREALDEKLDLTERLTAALGDDPNVEVGWGPQLTTVAVPAARRRDDERQRSCWSGSTRRSACSCPAR